MKNQKKIVVAFSGYRQSMFLVVLHQALPFIDGSNILIRSAGYVEEYFLKLNIT
jgi:hypothetical protein